MLCKKCVYNEIGNSVGGPVKGYALVKECDECKTKREADNTIRAEQEKIRKAEIDKETLIQARMREIAEKQLRNEGKL
jgi:hypothetical protein